MERGPEHLNHAAKSGRLIHTLRCSPEGRVLLLGVAVTGVHFLVLLVLSIWQPEASLDMLWMTIIHMMTGRAAGLSYGYGLEYGHLVVIPGNMVIETFMVLILYPLFVFAWTKALHIGFLKRHFEETRAAAEANRGWLRKFGVLGLFVFVWLPFWMTGPVVGCAIGYIIGLKPRVNLAIVLSGTYVAIASWALVLHSLHEAFSSYTPYAPVVIIAIIFTIVVAAHIVQRSRKPTP